MVLILHFFQTSSGDMFLCCDSASEDDTNTQILDLYEPESSLSALLRLLHSPPSPPVQFLREPIGEKVITQLPIRYDLATAIPLPVLRLLFCLAYKYALSDPDVLESLRAHLLAHAPVDALTVYGLSLALGDMPYVVSESSQYILPLARYSLDEIKVVPTVGDYHNVHRLQTFRVKTLQEILVREELFPHGECPASMDLTPSNALIQGMECAPPTTLAPPLPGIARASFSRGKLKRVRILDDTFLVSEMTVI